MMTLQSHMLHTQMSSAALHYSPPQDKHHHEDRLDLLDERQEFYKLSKVPGVSQISSGVAVILLCLVATTEGRLSLIDIVDIVVLE
ncbi:hypothetical protein Tco_1156581 [Tanacetum coccineum]